MSIKNIKKKKIGVGGGRTRDLSLAKQALLPLSYYPKVSSD